MKLKKLLKVLAYRQPIRIEIVNGSVITKDKIQYWDDYYRPLNPKIGNYKVKDVRHIHDDLEIPDFQDYINITIIKGGNDKCLNQK
jgi:hypothetical protein